VVFRRLAAIVAVSLLLVGLASCRSDPSVAAYVGDKQITLDQIDDYYAQAAKDSLTSDVVSQRSAEIKPWLVSMLVYLSLLKDAAAKNHLAASPGEIAQAKEAVEPQRSSLTDQRVLLPLEALAELEAYQELMVNWAGGGGGDNTAANQKFTAALKTSLNDNPVTVNPRFGKFDLNKVPTMPSADVAVTPLPSASAAS
jgi:hypothetical protein